MALGDLKVFDIVANGLVLQVTAIDLGGGQVRFSVECISGFADINAVYWGDNVADGSNFDLGTKKDNSLNMNGTGMDFDAGYKVSSTGLGPQGTDKPSYLTAGEEYNFTTTANWDDIDQLGVRATSTSTPEGSIKGVDGGATVIEAPCIAINDVEVTEGVDATAAFTISIDHAYDYDIVVTYSTSNGSADATDFTSTSGTVTILAGQTTATALVSVPILDDNVAESTETFNVNITEVRADIPGSDISLLTDHCDVLGVGTILDSDTGGGGGGGGGPPEPPAVQTAFSHGYWKEQGFADSEGFAAGVGSNKFDAFFTLDDPTSHTWTDKVGPNTVPFATDLTFAQAVTFGNGNGTGDFIDPGLVEEEADLVREAATAVLNFYDEDNSQSFIDWYIYERNLTNPDGDLSDNPTDADSVLADLKAQVDATLSGDPAAEYTATELATLLQATHH
jgi:hypothetical protein